MAEFKYDPFVRPNAYDVLGITNNALRVTARDIGKAYNKQKKAARRIKNTEEKAKRLEELEAAKERLQRPEDRVLIDFFQLGEDVFADLCVSFGRRLADVGLPTGEIIGPLLPEVQYDDLLPAPLDQFHGEFHLVDDSVWHDNAAEDQVLRLCEVEV